MLDPSTLDGPQQQGVNRAQSLGGGGALEGVSEAFEGLSERQRKVMQLRQKLQECRKANQHAVVAEKKRQKVRSPRA